MRSRAQIQEAFVDRFYSGERRSDVTVNELNSAELELKSKFPSAYREFITRFGIIYTRCILAELVDNNIEHVDVQDFLCPQELIQDNQGYWSAGMPEYLIGVASDCMGNMIGFRRQSEATDDAPVLFFDHDFVKVSEVAPSFDEFLTWYLDNLKLPKSSEI